ncbi:hypothetical protein ACFYOY_13540 [Streptomyces sp. NPDC007875]|uniref:hypothetical protein n=1 Tax=Streptomyces sp. NPDC007875 TaxID=3364783 RepID=UPI0036D1DB48
MATVEPEPIRRSDLPPIPSPESEFFTWFPLPDGGGDMVRGQRHRGVQVRRRVTYGDWEPVRPGRWADEPACDHDSQVIDHEGAQHWACMKCGQNLGHIDGPAASNDTADPPHQPPLHALLARLIADGRHHAYAAAHSKAEELARSHEGFAAGFHVAAVYVADLIATGRVRADQQIRAEDEVAARRVADIPSVDPAQWARAIGDAIYGTPAERTHIGGNAEDCPGCHGTNPPYPFICPGPDEPTA